MGVSDDERMRECLSLAQIGKQAGEVPVGALVTDSRGAVIGRGYNQPIGAHDPTAHAEIVALREAAKVAGNYRLPGSTLFVTLEPCTMCVGALVHARVERLVFAAHEPKAGASALLSNASFNHRVLVTDGVLADESQILLQSFFAERRSKPGATPA